MNKFVLVEVKGNSYKIGKNEYDTKNEALTRQKELSKLGINLEVMTFEEACGI